MSTNPPSATCAICGAIASLPGFHPHPRNGKVARLPQHLRSLINQMLDDGLPYRAIIEKLRASPTPLPWALSTMNLSNWFRGGYQDFRRQRLEQVAGVPVPDTPLASAQPPLPHHPIGGKSR